MVWEIVWSGRWCGIVLCGMGGDVMCCGVVWEVVWCVVEGSVEGGAVWCGSC